MTPSTGFDPSVPNHTGSDPSLLQRLLKDQVLIISSFHPGQENHDNPVLQTRLLLDGDVIALVTNDDLPDSLWQAHERLVASTLAELRRDLRRIARKVNATFYVVLGVTFGAVQVYPSCTLCDAQWDITDVMTDWGLSFIGSLTLAWIAQSVVRRILLRKAAKLFSLWQLDR